MMHWLSLLGRCGDTIACALKDLERRISLLVGMHRRFIDAQTLVLQLAEVAADGENM